MTDPAPGETAVSFYSTARPRSPRPTGKGWASGLLVLVVLLVVVAAIAAFEGMVSMGTASGWFGSSAQVIWTPPRWFSRVAWVGLFLLLAVAGWFIWRLTSAGARTSRVLYVCSLVLLTVWPPVYLDGYPMIGTSALWIAFAAAFLLVVALVVLVGRTWNVTRTAAALLIPAAGWIFYVATINFGDAVLASLG